MSWLTLIPHVHQHNVAPEFCVSGRQATRLPAQTPVGSATLLGDTLSGCHVCPGQHGKCGQGPGV